jgi:hypothetical protein
MFIAFSTIAVKAQLYITVEPAYFRPGILYNYVPVEYGCGVYGKIWYGDIQKKTAYDHFYTQNIKVGFGVSFCLNERSKIFLGVNQNYYFDYTKESTLVNWNNVHYISFDIGVDMRISERFAFLMMSDLLNWESIIGINFKLGKL